MARKAVSGKQDFERIIVDDYFYVDKTNFIKEWWESGNDVTLITRPRRFGKTLTISMVECFFSVKYKDRGELFEGLNIWKEEKYRNLQGTYPVISISFAGVKGSSCESAKNGIFQLLSDLYDKRRFLLEKDFLTEREYKYFNRVLENMSENDAAISLNSLCDFLQRYYGKKAIVLLDEYDTPMHDAYVHGYWDELVTFLGSLFNFTFKTNPYLERAIMTGITRVSKESIFSDLNNLEVVTTTSKKYMDSFGFTGEEVSAALGEFGLSDKEDMVKDWYDGFTFGKKSGIYNPWSIINFLEKKEFRTYWVNTSSNKLVDELVRKGSKKVKLAMEDLLRGNTIHTNIDEQIVYSQPDYKENAIWSLLLASGYLKVEKYQMDAESGKEEYDLKLTNKEVKIMFRNMIEGWFQSYSDASYNNFVEALLTDHLSGMNDYMNKIALTTFSYFDAGRASSGAAEPERFYHGFVLGMTVDLSDRYVITSNRESGLGRYDVMLKPRQLEVEDAPAIIMEFKVHDPKDEKTLGETAQAALAQIREKNYAAALIAEGIPKNRIREYGFAFEGKKVLIDGGSVQQVGRILAEAREKRGEGKRRD